MYSWRRLAGCIGFLLPVTVWAQFPPTPEGITILKSKFNENITISYKEVRMEIESYAEYRN